MFEIEIEFDDGPFIIEVGDFEQMWEIKEWLEEQGFDVSWSYDE